MGFPLERRVYAARWTDGPASEAISIFLSPIFCLTSKTEDPGQEKCGEAET